MQSANGDSVNDGSVVGLPNSSSDEEESSTDELVRAGDALCRKLEQEQGPEKILEVDVDTVADSSSSSDKQPNLAQIETKSTPSPSSDDSSCDSRSDVPQQELSLEERVNELETKLATLSRILQQQQRLSVRNLVRRVYVFSL